MKRLILFLLVIPLACLSQSVRWSTDGNSFYQLEEGEIVKYVLADINVETFLGYDDLTMNGQNDPGEIKDFSFGPNGSQVLVFTNTKRVWRLNTQGDYWVYDLPSKSWHQLGKSLPSSSLRFAELSPDGKMAAYVSDFDLYVEELTTGKIMPVTSNHSRKLITGTFDWAYEEEFSCRDGLQWSPDSKRIAYWQVDATGIPDYLMINYTDSVYSHTIPVEYPTIGNKPSPARIGVVSVADFKTTWLDIPGDPSQHYLPRLEWNSSTQILVQQLNRKQNESKIFLCNPLNGSAKVIHSEREDAWVDLFQFMPDMYALDFRHPFVWINHGKEFLWGSEKDGWKHLYRVDLKGKEVLLTRGDYDVIEFVRVDETAGLVYFIASPDNATQRYLFKARLDGKGKSERVTPADQPGSHAYEVSPNGKYALHVFSNTETEPISEVLDVENHKPLGGGESIGAYLSTVHGPKRVEFFKVKTVDGVEMDGWMVKPDNFDPAKKYPVLFFVYSEPAGQTVTDSYGATDNDQYIGSLAADGYIYISLDGRGTPAPKGRVWRKSIYRNIGRINIRDQAMAAKEILKWPFVDSERIAVWGWSGGGAATLNLMFQYPDIYKTGIAIAAVTNQLTYDNIYQERYMGLPQENLEDIVAGSPITYAKNLRGNLLYIHGTGDDNVHYNNAEMLVDELIKFNKQFQLMIYPNRTHHIDEGQGTSKHLATLFTNYLKAHCPPGGR